MKRARRYVIGSLKIGRFVTTSESRLLPPSSSPHSPTTVKRPLPTRSPPDLFQPHRRQWEWLAYTRIWVLANGAAVRPKRRMHLGPSSQSYRFDQQHALRDPSGCNAFVRGPLGSIQPQAKCPRSPSVARTGECAGRCGIHNAGGANGSHCSCRSTGPVVVRLRNNLQALQCTGPAILA